MVLKPKDDITNPCLLQKLQESFDLLSTFCSFVDFDNHPNERSVEMFRRISSFVRVAVAKNPNVQCTNVNILTQPPALASCQKIDDSF